MMVQLISGKVTSKFFLSLILSSLLITFSCDKEKCYTIRGKEIINGEYYFLLNNNVFTTNSSNRLSSGVPDPYGTGKVNKETYDSVNVGDQYCE